MGLFDARVVEGFIWDEDGGVVGFEVERVWKIGFI